MVAANAGMPSEDLVRFPFVNCAGQTVLVDVIEAQELFRAGQSLYVGRSRSGCPFLAQC